RNCSFQQSFIQLMGHHALSKRLQSSLGKGRLRRANTSKHHLPPQVDNRELHRFRVRRPHISLKEHDHAQKCRRMRLFSRAGVPVRLLQSRLERVIEQLVPVLSQKSEEWPHPCQALHQPLLLCRQLDRGLPSIHRLTSCPFHCCQQTESG